VESGNDPVVESTIVLVVDDLCAGKLKNAFGALDRFPFLPDSRRVLFALVQSPRHNECSPILWFFDLDGSSLGCGLGEHRPGQPNSFCPSLLLREERAGSRLDG
jgi:hypothetical protein